MKRIKKYLISLTLILALVCSAGVVSFAQSPGQDASADGQISTRSVIYYYIGLTRASSTLADIDIEAYSDGYPDRFTATITLQEKTFGSSTWTNSSADPIFVERTNTDQLFYSGSIGVTNTKNYRLKVVFKEYFDGTTVTTTRYSNSI